MRKTVLAVLALATAATATDLVRGRIDRYVPPDIVTASGVRVLLWRADTLKDSAVTGQDGMFYFVSVPKGAYHIEVIPPAEYSGLGRFEYKFAAGTKPVMDLPLQMLNRFSFEQPAENATVKKDDTIDAAGSHSYPSGTVMWLLFRADRRKRCALGDSLVLEAGRPWSIRLKVPIEAVGLSAVLATPKARGDFGATAGEPGIMPKGARIVATRWFAKE